MNIGPAELFILFLILCIYVVVPAVLIFVVILFYQRLKKIEDQLRSLEEKMSGTP